jgi:hypothetical protein
MGEKSKVRQVFEVPKNAGGTRGSGFAKLSGKEGSHPSHHSNEPYRVLLSVFHCY